jgi:hypothetical protein
MGRENPRWGCLRIKGELAKLGITVSAIAIRARRRDVEREGCTYWDPAAELVSFEARGQLLEWGESLGG